jgi:hypothetical protein
MDHADIDHTGLTGVSGNVSADTIWDAAGDLIQGTGANTAAKLTAGSAGQFLKSAGAAAANSWAYPPGYQFDYVEFTSNVSPTNTLETNANTVVTSNAVAYDGSTRICIEFYAEYARPDTGAAARNLRYYLYDDTGGGAASIGRIGVQTSPAAADSGKPVLLRRFLTPSSATHTYSVRAAVSAGTGLITAGAGGNGNLMPGYIRQSKA